MAKKILLTILFSVTLLAGTGFWLKSLIPPPPDHQALAQTQPGDIPYLQQPRPAGDRGRILMVVTSASTMGEHGKDTGYELTELARSYYVFTANGFTVDIASPRGGEPPAVIDRDDMGPIEYAFLNDQLVKAKLHDSIPVAQANAGDYRGIFFVGGKGAMFDFPGNADIHNLVASIYGDAGVVGAVCHGPAALADIELEPGVPLLQGRRISSFTNEEELFLIPEAEEVFPFLLESRLRENGAVFEAGPAYLRQVSTDGRLVTGQNPWSVWALAEEMVKTLGYQPVQRKVTSEENTVELLLAYETDGHRGALTRLETFQQAASGEGEAINRRLLAMHGIVAVMQGRVGKAVDIVRLLSAAKKWQQGKQV
ncbi:type 1 glutamine amidotransferase domain-containing protein [Microbulbifer sp. YPW16]|uniref:type 1 glutamine amidotransferase domain-containing protein n=1 Tax=Microbulbifer sp. YPW16 TaxID=2904242 RepID=UPI001E44E105|nr:type 1 glutamine amidotransferase domain-containing protein [Microbulbifer sp. YPW16]UHQ54404.1 type 1 glutamine amidotransferase domain-containing protein [Microbulbifer sp. YPW16]